MNSVREFAYQAGRQKNWNAFRSVYDLLTIEDLIDINIRWDVTMPPQRCASYKLVLDAFKSEKFGSFSEIVELGCHRGHLAKEILKNVGDVNWTGYDINKAAINDSVITLGFTAIHQVDWFWNINIAKFDTFVSTHTLEHMN